MNVANARVPGGTQIRIGDPGIADDRGARPRRLGHAENSPLKVAEISVKVQKSASRAWPATRPDTSTARSSPSSAATPHKPRGSQGRAAERQAPPGPVRSAKPRPAIRRIQNVMLHVTLDSRTAAAGQR